MLEKLAYIYLPQMFLSKRDLARVSGTYLCQETEYINYRRIDVFLLTHVKRRSFKAKVGLDCTVTAHET